MFVQTPIHMVPYCHIGEIVLNSSFSRARAHTHTHTHIHNDLSHATQLRYRYNWTWWNGWLYLAIGSTR